MNVLGRVTVLAPAATLTIEHLDDGTVIWDPHSARLHHLDLPARELWRLVDGGRSLAGVFELAALTFGVTSDVIRRDAMPFLADLVTKGLLAEKA